MYALVTDAGSGIGARAVERLLERGYEVCATDTRGLERWSGTHGTRIRANAYRRFPVPPHPPHPPLCRHHARGRVREVAAADALNVMDVNYGGMVRLVSWSS